MNDIMPIISMKINDIICVEKFHVFRTGVRFFNWAVSK